MESLAEFMASLSDREFAFFVTYRAKEFLADSREVIAREIVRRGLSTEVISELTLPGRVILNDNCPRCQAHNFVIDMDRSRISTQYGVNREMNVLSRRCNICGYNPAKDKPLNFRVRLGKWFGRYTWMEEVPKGF